MEKELSATEKLRTLALLVGLPAIGCLCWGGLIYLALRLAERVGWLAVIR